MVLGAMWDCPPPTSQGWQGTELCLQGPGSARAHQGDVWAKPTCTMACMGLPAPIPGGCGVCGCVGPVGMPGRAHGGCCTHGCLCPASAGCRGRYMVMCLTAHGWRGAGAGAVLGAGPLPVWAPPHPPPVSLVCRQPVGRVPQGLGSGLQPLRAQPRRHAAGHAGHPRAR